MARGKTMAEKLTNDSKLTVTIRVSTESESTSYPWWVIIDPSQNMRCSVHNAASQITGPFFSRESAQKFLDATRYNFTKRAVVYCLSGTHSMEWENAIDIAMAVK